MSLCSKLRILAPRLTGSGRQFSIHAFKAQILEKTSFSKNALGQGVAATLFGALGIGGILKSVEDFDLSNINTKIVSNMPGVVYAKPCQDDKAKGNCCMDPCLYQNNITAPPTMYSLFLWISLDQKANPKCVAEIAANMDSLVDSVTSPCDSENEDVIAGVGFGPNYYNQIMGKTWRNYYYTHRKGRHGELPATQGDIFLHAKCNNLGKLFDVCKNYICSFPEGAISEFEDIYG